MLSSTIPDAGVESPTLLVDVETVAKMLSCSTRNVYRLSDAGRMPEKFKLGGLVRWNRGALESWIQEGGKSCRRAGR
jgi:excisionase family DNA binding protein